MTFRNILLDLVTNQVLVSGALGWFIAQLIKIILEVIRGGWKAARPAGGGGMPSTHSSTVSSLTIAAGLTDGFHSTQFALAAFLAMIVIYDAAGVRYETGQEARALNRLRERDLAQGVPPLYDKPLQEQMGHTIPQIIVGILIGCTVGFVVCKVIYPAVLP